LPRGDDGVAPGEGLIVLGAMAAFGVTVAGATAWLGATAWFGTTLAGAALFEFPPRGPKPP
jgi:hypothetical protein